MHMAVPDVLPGFVGVGVLGTTVSFKKKRTHSISIRKNKNDQFFFSVEGALGSVSVHRYKNQACT